MSIILSAYKKLSEIDSFYANAIMYHRTHKNKGIRFNGFNYLKALYKDKSRHKVLMKSTQAGVSEYLIARAINDCINNYNVLYVMPTDVIKARFVQSRVNKTIDYTDFYKQFQKGIDSAQMKAFNMGVVNFIGSNSEASFTEFVANVVIIDELDQCSQSNIVMAKERQSAQKEKWYIEVSNPTILGYGIDDAYSLSDKKKWMLKCDHCNEWINPNFFNNVVEKTDKDEYVIKDREFTFDLDRDCRLVCDKCNSRLERFKDGEWVSEETNDVSGYHVNKLFSGAVEIRELLKNFNDGLANDRKMQRFYNADLGLPFTSEGSKISDEMLDKCVRDYSLKESSKNPCIMGIDVGSVLSIVIGEVSDKIRIIAIKELQSKQDILDLFRQYNIILSIIDSRPEARLSRSLTASLKQMWMVDYLTESARDTFDLTHKIYKTDRTTSLDGVKEAIVLEQIELPKNAKSIKGFYSQMTAATRIWQENSTITKEGRYVWVEGSKRDDWHHSMNYLMIAKKILMLAK